MVLSKLTDADQKHSYQLLRGIELKAESEGFILAAQDKSLLTRNYRTNVMKNAVDPKCWYCNDGIDSVGHFGCKVLAPVEYKLTNIYHGRYDGIIKSKLP